MTGVELAASDILRAAGVGRADWAVVLGTGLGAFADALENAVSIPYDAIPGFPKSGVSGHASRLVAGRIGKARVVALQGRAHYYERGDAAIMRAPIATLAALGIGGLILTNAAGGLREDLTPGAVALITDHINFSGRNPLIGEEGDARFVPMVNAYDPALNARFRAASARMGLDLPEGVYMWFSGPSFETPAEVRMAKMLGADLVGMSTVPEVILARRYGLRCAALSLVTNYGAGLFGGAPSHAETRAVAAAGSEWLIALLNETLREPLPESLS